MASSFKLSATLEGHEDDVRCVVSPYNDMIISGSRDCTVRVWRKLTKIIEQEPNLESEITEKNVETDEIMKDDNEDEKIEKNDKEITNIDVKTPPETIETWENPLINYKSTAFINCLTFVDDKSNNKQYIASGGNEKIVNLTLPIANAFDNEPEYSLIGHKLNICSLDSKNDLILSGSWDGTAKVWNDEGKLLYTLIGHENSVWGAKIISQNEFITCGADRTIRLWLKDKEVKRFNNCHSDVIRDILVLPTGFASCSNDNTIKIWDKFGSLKKTLYGHDNFVYSLDILPNGDLISCGEDRSIRIWRDFNCIQVITLPCISVWKICVSPNGDIISASSDNLIRIFSRELSRQSDKLKLEEFDKQVKNFAIQQQNLNKEDVPPISILQKKGKKEGETKIVKTSIGTIEAHQWIGDKWMKIGDVLDSAGSNDKKIEFNGKKYDYVFDVDVQEGSPPLKLPYNANDNPYTSAEKFLADNELPYTYLDEVVKFILSNTSGVSLGNNNDINNNSGDNNNNGSEISNPYNNNTNSSQNASNENSIHNPDKTNLLSLNILPQREYLIFDTYDPSKIIIGLKKLNEKENLKNRFSEEELNNFTNAINLELKGEIYEFVEKIIKNWSNTGKLVGFDILRHLILGFKLPPSNLFDLIKIGLGYIFDDNGSETQIDESVNSSESKTLMMAIRCLCNIFSNNQWGEGSLNDVEILHIVLNKKVISFSKIDKFANISIITFLLNMSVLCNKYKNEILFRPIFQKINDFGNDLISIPNYYSNFNESCYRIVIAYGTLSYMKKVSGRPRWLMILENQFSADEKRFKDIFDEIHKLNN
ncbi:hypothetical protein B5S32_g2283 [[Candida] boidinii]|nr:hypothetical protein B5S32_g2283 [[Candida] boidinii]